MVCGTLNAFLGQVLGGYKEVSKRTVITNFVGTPAMMILTVLFVTWGMGLRGYISAPVSYTHLDVYKRQLQACVFHPTAI